MYGNLPMLHVPSFTPKEFERVCARTLSCTLGVIFIVTVIVWGIQTHTQINPYESTQFTIANHTISIGTCILEKGGTQPCYIGYLECSYGYNYTCMVTNNELQSVNKQLVIDSMNTYKYAINAKINGYNKKDDYLLCTLTLPNFDVFKSIWIICLSISLLCTLIAIYQYYSDNKIKQTLIGLNDLP